MISLYTSETKNRILEESINLFSDLGYTRVTVRNIAQKCGIEAASIYNHFKSKEDILDGVYDFILSIYKITVNDRAIVMDMIHENAPFDKIIEKMFTAFPDDYYDIMIKCYRILIMEQYVNERAKRYLINMSFIQGKETLNIYLKEMIKHKLIKPIDTDELSTLWSKSLFFSVFLSTHGQSTSLFANEFQKPYGSTTKYLIDCLKSNKLV